jgi:hypothetical protein
VERDERDHADALDRYWDALLRGEATSTTTDLDPGLATLVARVQAAGSALPLLFPDPDRAWRELRQASAPSAVAWSDGETTPPPWPHPNGHADLVAERRSAPPLPQRGGSGVLAHLATAALLLLLLAVGFAAIRQRMPEARDEGRWVPAFVRVLESAPGSILDTPLIEATFTGAELPGGEKEAAYYQLTIPPGESLPYLGGPFCGCRTETITKGVGVEVVQAGTYTIRLEAPLRVHRAGTAGPDEEIPAGTEVTLGAGDAVIYPDYAAPGDIRNTGNEPVTLIGVAIMAPEGSGTPLPTLPMGVTTTLLTHTNAPDWEAVPPGPLNVALHQVTLPAGTSVGPYEPVGLQAMRIESGTITRSFVPNGDTVPVGQPLAHQAGSTTPFLRISPGFRETLASSGQKPAELLVLLIEPAGISAQSLAS